MKLVKRQEVHSNPDFLSKEKKNIRHRIPKTNNNLIHNIVVDLKQLINIHVLLSLFTGLLSVFPSEIVKPANKNR